MKMFERLKQSMVKEPCNEIICIPLGSDFDFRILDSYDEVYIRIFNDDDASGPLIRYKKDLKNLEEISKKIEEEWRRGNLNRVDFILKDDGKSILCSYLIK